VDLFRHNARAWDREVERGNPWTVPASPEEIAAARAGRPRIVLTPTKPVPADWFPPLAGCDTLCLASGGGQQGPVLAAAGARVTVFDASPRQLDRDRETAEREGLALRAVEGDMADLSLFEDRSFDLIVHPVSNCFVPDIRPVWREARRVLRPGGVLLAGFCNPLLFLITDEDLDAGRFVITRKVPWSDLRDADPAARERLVAEEEPLQFGHTLEEQIGGQIEAGLAITGLYEDVWPELDGLSAHTPLFLATRAERPGHPSPEGGSA